ncbi:hypothetical protein PPYR_14464 [Photinus pyralis]|uniref:DNA-directed RNA polymerase III subunit RPC8 n=1 Tax=Photinus pyralis TaxID=7054 RepID=A0A1Y1MJY6_PHOPY|nr:DNA-directed RNA polymerase III subunit RPC8 [Photinus pyralis]KAB0792505.1 hypothetical protein PPYR_14464 [Photinus pyralis]
MFILVEMKNVTRITPDLFNIKLNDAIASELNKKLANKVVLNVGLCIALYDITSLQESFIFPGDGSSHTRVSFRYIVFRPFAEEILLGKIRSSSAEGVHVSLGFFDDIIIPPTYLQHPSRFDETEQAWVWEYDTGDGSKHDLFMDTGEPIRFKVTAEAFQETCPSTTFVPTAPDAIEKSENKTPYIITGSINEPGLGLLTWWDN